MSRFLFVVPPVTERVVPTVEVGAELAARGHDVVWTTNHPLVPDGAVVPFLPAPTLASAAGDPGAVLEEEEVAAMARAAAGVRGPLAPLVRWDDLLLPLARATLPAVQAAADLVRPDMVIADQWSLAGAAVGARSGRPWATFVPTSAGVAVGHQVADLPDIARQLRARSRRFLLDAGVDELSAARMDPEHSSHLVVAFTTEALAGTAPEPDGVWTYVGPALGSAGSAGSAGYVDDADVPFNWGRLDPSRPLVTVAFETPHWRHGPGMHEQMAGALAGAGVQAVMVAPPDLVPSPPPGMVVVPRAPLGALVARSAAVICDGGHATVCRSLAHGVPLMVVPLGGDQPVVAGQVSRSGGGVRLTAMDAGPRQLKAAIETVVADSAVRAGAVRLQDSFAAAGGSSLAADRLEALVGAGTLGAGRFTP